LKEQLKAAHKREDEQMARVTELRSNLRKAEEGRRMLETKCEDLQRQLVVSTREIEAKDEAAEDMHKLKVQLDAALSVAHDNLSISQAEIEALKKKVARLENSLHHAQQVQKDANTNVKQIYIIA
jgi:chromosome segregation ATPase